MTRRIVLDCDTGTDDAVAIMLAALHPDLDLLGVTTVHGNADVAVTTDNTLRVLDHVGRRDVPVLAGLGSPSAPRPAGVAVRGGGGRGDDVLPLPVATIRAGDQPAVDWLVDLLRDATEQVTLVQTGPLTNLAAVLDADPRLVGAVDELVVLGGTHAVGNVTPSADRNFFDDARAAAGVLGAGFERLLLVTLDATSSVALTGEHAAALRALGTPAGVAAATFHEQRVRDHAALPSMRARAAAPLHDPLAVAYLLDPSVVRLQPLHVAVETGGLLTYGRSVIDVDGVGGGTPNVHVALTADLDAYWEVLRSTLARRGA
jgi:inosine-uridine nucleoside N-ribohydrolase